MSIQPKRAMSSCRVVIADDSLDLRLLLRLALRADPELEVVAEASNGAEAVSMVTDLKPELLLLDLSMPVMDGLEALPLIRVASPRTAVIIVSGFLNAELQDRVLEAGAVGFIEKGDDLAKLVEFVQGVRQRLQ